MKKNRASIQIHRTNLFTLRAIVPRIFGVTLTLLLAILFAFPAQALERRRDQFGKDFSYFIYPIASEIPGLGTATGYGASVLNMFGTDADFTGFNLDGDFSASGYALLDMHLLPRTLIFDVGAFDFEVAPLVFRRGMDSRQEDYIQPNVKGDYQLGQLTYTVAERLFEAYYRLAAGSYRVKSVFDKDGNQFENLDQTTYNIDQITLGWVLDYTDDRLDPRQGIRYEWARKMPQSDDPLGSEFAVVDQNLTFYVPFREIDTLAVNIFRSDASITRQGPTDYESLRTARGLDCGVLSGAALEQCLAAEQESLDEKIAENKYGNATPLGGTQRLRSYPGGRFYAGHTLFYGLEYRLNLQDVNEPFDVWIARGVRTGFQLAFFAGRGGAADDPADLMENMRTTYGFGARVLFSGVIVRLDYAIGDEGASPQLFINYPFGMFSVDSPG